MARTVNRVTLLGNLGRAPDVSIATKRREGDAERTLWHRLTFRGRLAEFARDNLQQDDRVFVEGSIDYDIYERDGVTIPTADIIVANCVLLTPRGEG